MKINIDIFIQLLKNVKNQNNKKLKLYQKELDQANQALDEFYSHDIEPWLRENVEVYDLAIWRYSNGFSNLMFGLDYMLTENWYTKAMYWYNKNILRVDYEKYVGHAIKEAVRRFNKKDTFYTEFLHRYSDVLDLIYDQIGTDRETIDTIRFTTIPIIENTISKLEIHNKNIDVALKLVKYHTATENVDTTDFTGIDEALYHWAS